MFSGVGGPEARSTQDCAGLSLLSPAPCTPGFVAHLQMVPTAQLSRYHLDLLETCVPEPVLSWPPDLLAESHASCRS